MIRLARFIEIFRKNITSIGDIESVLIHGTEMSSNTSSSLDSQLIRMKINGLANFIGDTIDYVDVSQLVARHLCTRYRSQLICLYPTPAHSLSMVELSTSSVPLPTSTSSSSKSSWWSCCKSRPPSPPILSRAATSIDQSNVLERISTFAIAFLLYSINRENHRMASSLRTPRKDALATRLVLIISRAYRHDSAKYPLPIDQAAVSKVGMKRF